MSAPFQWNPFTNNLDHTSVGGGPGNVTIVTDYGSITNSVIPVKGEPFKSVPVMDTAVINGEVHVANNTWDTAYVIAASDSFGEKGTFDNLQAAIDAIILDGLGTTSKPGLIRFRPGTYTYLTPIDIPNNLVLMIKGDIANGAIGGSSWPYDVSVTAEITGSSCQLMISDIVFNERNTDPVFSLTDSNFYSSNSVLGKCEFDSCQLQISNCTIVEMALTDTNSTFSKCVNGHMSFDGGGICHLIYCDNFTLVQGTGTNVIYSQFCNNCSFSGENSTGLTHDFNVIDAPITNNSYVIAGLLSEGNSLLDDLFDSPEVFQKRSTKGNVYVSRIIDDDYILDVRDHFIGVQGYIAPVDITLGFTTDKPMRSQNFVIADLEGTASTNNITLTPDGCLINNQSSFVMNVNFQCVQIYFDGDNYFTVLSNISLDQVPIGELSYFSNDNGDSYLNGKWLKCDGSVISQSTYSTLYSRMGLINGNGTVWTSRTSSAGGSALTALTFGNGIFVAGGASGTIVTSTDGITWTSRTSGTASNISALTFGNGIFLGSGTGGMIRTSTDGITWGAQTSGTVSGLFSATYGNGLYVVGGVGGVLLTSTDAITWNSRTSGTTSQINSMTYGNNLYVYGGAGGALRSSTDGITWDARSNGSASNVTVLSYQNSLYLSGNAAAGFYTSTDAITWNSKTTGLAASISVNGISFYNGLYVIVGSGGNIRTSTDTNSWAAQLSTTTTAFNSLIHGVNTYVAVGAAGIAFTGNDNYLYNSATSFQLPVDAQVGITIDLTTNFKRSLYIRAL